MRILKHPHKKLRQIAEPIDEDCFPDWRVLDKAAAMIHVARQYNGGGLAAPQVGWSVRLFVAWVDEDGWTIFVNPEIVKSSRRKITKVEGCLSFPRKVMVLVERSRWVKLKWTNIRGKRVKRRFKGEDARVVQHEMDHLSGTLIIDYLPGRKADANHQNSRRHRRHGQVSPP